MIHGIPLRILFCIYNAALSPKASCNLFADKLDSWFLCIILSVRHVDVRTRYGIWQLLISTSWIFWEAYDRFVIQPEQWDFSRTTQQLGTAKGCCWITLARKYSISKNCGRNISLPVGRKQLAGWSITEDDCRTFSRYLNVIFVVRHF